MRVMLDEGAIAPIRAHKTDAGYDLCSRENVVIKAGECHTFDTGVHVQIPHGWCGLLVSKSGLNVNHGINSTGLIDEAYTGSVRVKLYNDGSEDYAVAEGDKISQMVLLPYGSFDVVIVDELAETERGDAGFGSTGR